METCTVNNVSTAENWDCVSLVRPEGGTVDLMVTDPAFRGTFKEGDDVNVDVSGLVVSFQGRGKTAADKAAQKVAAAKADADLRDVAARQANAEAEKAFLASPEYKAQQEEVELARLRALKAAKDRQDEIATLKSELGEK